MGKRGNWYIVLLIIILLVSLVMLVLQNIPGITGNVSAKKASGITGHATVGTTYSNVSISQFVAIIMSPNLTAGIDFGNVATLPTLNQNATKNWCNAANGSCANMSIATFNQTLYFINVSNDSNTAVDFCIKADAGLTAGLNVIGLANETYVDNVTLTNITNPLMANKVSMTTGYIKAGINIPIGNASYWRFSLDIPGGQATGSYSNNVSFEGVNAGNAC